MKKFLILLIILINTQIVWADDFVPEGEVEEQTSADNFILDADNTGGDIQLQFGGNLAKYLKWDNTSTQFSLNGSVSLESNQLINFRIENLATAPTCDGTVSGRLYRNTTDSKSYICDGTSWVQIDGGSGTSGDMSTARYRDTSTTDLNAAATDNLVPWNTEDIEEATIFNHDTTTNNSRIQVLENGKYLVSGSISVANSSTSNFRYNGRVKFRINGVTVLPMRFQPGYIRQASGQTETSLVFSTILDLTANDYFEVLVDRENTTAGPANMISGQSSLSLVFLKAPKGDTGATGSAGVNGADGDIVWKGTWTSQNYLLHDTVEYQGSTYTCKLNTVSNEIPTNTTYWDLVASKGDKGDQGIPGTAGGGTDNESFVIDADDTGGNLKLQFGTTLNESLTWDATNSEFDLSDDLVLGKGVAEDIYLGFDDDGGTHHKFGWDDSEGNFSTFGEDIESECGPYGIFWAARGTIVSNAAWALGNGQTPYGSIMGCNGKVTKLAATCTGSIGTSLSAVLRKNNVATSCTVNISTTVGQATISNCNESFLSTDVLGVYAGTENGSWTECVGTFWVKYD